MYLSMIAMNTDKPGYRIAIASSCQAKVRRWMCAAINLSTVTFHVPGDDEARARDAEELGTEADWKRTQTTP